ncbi:MAG: ABC transporter ATP-binding protein, partial [Caldilineaceae bacterium]|nr:ABC transporter ATP-binding protein [Caldilineaceae bacterium]
AIVLEPTFLVADEPISMLDVSIKWGIIRLLKRLVRERGISLLYITHDLATAYYMCDRIAIMFRGDIVEMGAVEQVLMAPKHPYTQLLRASIPEADPAHRWQGEIRLTDTEQDEYLRQGCRFAGRCPLVMDICRSTPPVDLDVDGVHISCHKYGEAATPAHPA